MLEICCALAHLKYVSGIFRNPMQRYDEHFTFSKFFFKCFLLLLSRMACGVSISLVTPVIRQISPSRYSLHVRAVWVLISVSLLASPARI